jgi:hypothetical protein
VLNGTRAIHDVEPTSMFELDLAGLSNQGEKAHMTPGLSVGGATYDAMGKPLHILVFRRGRCSRELARFHAARLVRSR